MDPTYKGLPMPTPTSTRPTGSNINWRLGLIVVTGVIALVALIGVGMNLMTPNTANLSQRLVYRMDALVAMSTAARTNLKSDALSALNADFSSVISGDSAALKKIIGTAKMTTELTAIKKEETDTATTDRLKTALVNGAFDTAYKTVLTQKLEAATALLKELYGETSSSSLKQALVTTSDHISIYYQQLKKL